MSWDMKKLVVAGNLILLLALSVQQTYAQIYPVRLSVTKNRKTSQKTTQQSGGYIRSWTEQQIKETVSYTIEVANATTAPVPNVRIKWAILVKPGKKNQPEIIEGEQTCSLNLGTKYVFDTDIVELTGTKLESSDGQYRRDDSSRVLGYAVEVFIGNQRVAADIQPIDTKGKVEALKAEKEKGRPRHQF